MLDAALIKECADPSLKPVIVEQFVQAVGSDDPLAITVKSGGRLILIPKPKTPEEAIKIVRENIAGSIVRVGLTQIPAGIGLKHASELKVDLVEPCANLRMGTGMFAKILRIVAKWYGIRQAKRFSRSCSMTRSTPGEPVSSRVRACFKLRIRVARLCSVRR